jgi:hypothetical protein
VIKLHVPMKSLKPPSMLVLIASALLLSAVTHGAHAQTSVLPTVRNSQNAETIQNQPQTQEPPTPSAVLSPTTATSQPSPAPQAGDSAPNSQSWHDWFWENVPALLLAVLAVWAGCIGLRTLDAIRDQAQIARDALTQLERPWIIAIPKGEVIFGQEPGERAPSMTVRCEIEFVNSGRSPAWLISGAVCQFRGDRLRDTPDYTGADVEYSLTPLSPNDKLPDQSRLFVIGEDAGEDSAYRLFLKGSLKLAIFGYVTYRDAMQKESHETRFCMILDPPLGRRPCRLIFGGPEAYNRYT